MNTIFGTKIDQTQKFLENGTRIPVTVVQALDNPVVAVKTTELHGYQAVQVGYGARKKATKALQGHVKKANLESVPSRLQEIRVTGEVTVQPGDVVKVEETLAPGDIVDVTGQSKGKGFQNLS